MSAPDVLPYETASWGRRALALLVDWFACVAAVSLFTPVFGTTGGTGSFWTLLVFVVESALLTTTVGGSFGKMLTRLRTVRVDGGGRLDPLRSLARAILVALVIPPLVFRPDRRGLHDLAAGTATVTLQEAATRPGQ
ncbi:RDD family protein [Nocardioides sp. YIM 152315]|uniref:RDD family protein n=1 Tax=Nocardioides sp. YIM 152315 TaxID=3031760 RepID=UPI0023DC4E09|nr:RDD family protein [Nocardioides sp. YIM 152315]MDF1605485.1 RDD family protein [Nocardioides sp. YIM 152315]